MAHEIQTAIHSLTTGLGARLVRLVFVLIVVGATGGLYDVLCYRNLANREAMDMAQLGKNLAEGKGYTTLCVRPFSMFLLQKHRGDHSPQLKTPHPDITNPPVYPGLLAAVFKMLKAEYFVMPAKGFSVFKPELAVAILNQVLLLGAGLLLFLLAEKLFDNATAWATAIIFVGTEMLWRFSVSGLSTMLLLLLFLALVWCLVWLDQWTRHGRSDAQMVSLAATMGALVGVGGLTRYSFGWLIVPVLVYLIAFFGKRRAMLALAALGAFLLVMAPWVARNYAVSGMPFGTATFAACEGTGPFPEDRLQRSLNPNVRSVSYSDFAQKFLRNARDLVQNDLPKLGGSWVTAFFFVGLLVPFRTPTLARLRWFLLFCLVVFGLVQVLGRTSLSDDSPGVNSENLLVLLTPLVFLYGVALFFLLLNTVAMPFPAARLVITGGFCIVCSLPFIQATLPPRSGPVAHPPYYPPLLQRIGSWYTEQELIMSDMPWAVAWYGRRQSVWLTLNWKTDFVEISDYKKTINAIYITTLTTDTKFLSNWIRGQNQSWTSFMLETMLQSQVPTGFLLRRAPEGFFPEQMLLTDHERWKLKID